MKRPRPSLPPQVLDFLIREIKQSVNGEPRWSVGAERVFQASIEPLADVLAPALAPHERQPDGRLVFAIPRHLDFRDVHLAAGAVTIRATFDPASRRWTSDVAAGQPTLARFAGHVWRVKGGGGRMPERKILALLGLAYLFALQKGEA